MIPLRVPPAAAPIDPEGRRRHTLRLSPSTARQIGRLKEITGVDENGVVMLGIALLAANLATLDGTPSAARKAALERVRAEIDKAIANSR